MDVRQLKHFLAVVENANYARAANSINMSQSALTQSILRLEQDLGIRLFERGRFGATVTAAGEMLTERARLVLAEIHRAEAELGELKDAARGSVTVGLGRSLTAGLVANAIAVFAAARREVALTVSEGWSPDLYQRLLRGEFDFVVSSPQPGLTIDPELSAEVLFSQAEKLIIGRRHPLSGKEDLSLADLSSVLWAIPPRAVNRVDHLRLVFSAAGIAPPKHFIRSDSDTFGQALIREGYAVGLANIHMLTREIAEGEVTVAPLADLNIERDVILAVRRRSRPPPIAAALITVVRMQTRTAAASA